MKKQNEKKNKKKLLQQFQQNTSTKQMRFVFFIFYFHLFTLILNVIFFQSISLLLGDKMNDNIRTRGWKGKWSITKQQQRNDSGKKNTHARRCNLSDENLNNNNNNKNYDNKSLRWNVKKNKRNDMIFYSFIKI